MSTWLAVSKSRPIRDTRRPLPTRKVAEAPLSPRYARDRRTEGERSEEGWGRKSTGTTEEKGQTSGAKHHPPRAPKGTYVCGCMYHSYSRPRGGFLSSLPVAHSRATPRCSTAQLLNTARTTRLRHDGEHAALIIGTIPSKRSYAAIYCYAPSKMTKSRSGVNWTRVHCVRASSKEISLGIWTNAPIGFIYTWKISENHSTKISNLALTNVISIAEKGLSRLRSNQSPGYHLLEMYARHTTAGVTCRKCRWIPIKTREIVSILIFGSSCLRASQDKTTRFGYGVWTSVSSPSCPKKKLSPVIFEINLSLSKKMKEDSFAEHVTTHSSLYVLLWVKLDYARYSLRVLFSVNAEKKRQNFELHWKGFAYTRTKQCRDKRRTEQSVPDHNEIFISTKWRTRRTYISSQYEQKQIGFLASI